MGVGGFLLPSLGIINAPQFLTDLYAIDYAETTALENSYNNI
jgi:hypothetical protein